jgi:hypothetical protein
MSDEKITVDSTGRVDVPQGATGDVLKVVGHLTKWKTYAIYALLAVVVAEGAYIVWQRGNVAEAKLEVANKDKELQQVILERDLAKMNEKSCRINLDDQNGKITDAGKRYDRLQAEMVELARKIANGDFYDKADDVRNQTTPKSCQEALDFMNRNFP